MAAQTGTESTADDAGGVAGEAADRAREVGQDAKAGATAVVDSAKDQVRGVTSELSDQARSVLGDATSELESQLDDRLQRLASAARERTGELHALADGRSEEAGATADWARSLAGELGRLADRAQDLGPRGVADEVAGFARRRPLAFLAGAAAAGFVVGRLVRNAGGSAEPDRDAPGAPAGALTAPDAPEVAPGATESLAEIGPDRG